MALFLLLTIVFLADNMAFCEVHFASSTYKAVKIPKNKIIVYPNPWIPESGISAVPDDPKRKNTLKHGSLAADGWIKFAGMQKETGTLKIYDITGNLVKNFRWNASTEKENFPVAHYEFSKKNNTILDYYESQEYSDTQNTRPPNYNIIHWDGKDNNFEYVKSGVYIWILSEDGGLTHHGKIAVVR